MSEADIQRQISELQGQTQSLQTQVTNLPKKSLGQSGTAAKVANLTAQVASLQNQVKALPAPTPPSSGPTQQNVVTRSLGVVYHNTTGGPMWITVSITGDTAATAVSDSSPSPGTQVAQGATFTFIVLSGNYYSVSSIGSIQNWVEWN